MRASSYVLARLVLVCSSTFVIACAAKGSPNNQADAGPSGPQCSDGVDNDGDGKTDFPNDPGCLNPNQDSETDDCPSGPNCPQCGNGQDDDGDGKIDYGQDPDCASASDNTEIGVNTGACGTDVTVLPMPTTGVATGTIVVGNSHLVSACGGLGPETVYQIDVATPIVLTATTDVQATGVDTVLYLRSANCTDSASEVTCNDNASGSTTASTIQAALQPGTYYLIVDAATSTAEGGFELHVTRSPGVGQPCDATHACASGFYCRPAPGASADTCQPPRCSDTVDNDSPADGKIDYPNDPGCDSPADDDEVDDCPDGPSCPACSNNKDDDNDTKIDFGSGANNDPGCLSASQPIEGCATEQDPVAILAAGTATGSTAALHDDWNLDCTDTSGSGDAVYLANLPRLDSLTISTDGSSFDTVLGLYDQTCGTSLDCNDEDPNLVGPSLITRTNVAAGLYAIVLDGYAGDAGTYTLTVSGVITAGGRCDGALAAAGALTCATGTACDGTICKGTLQCNDGIDNDSPADGKIDYPNDPGCTGPLDDTEADDCPTGPNCPVCSNAQDDDHDGKTDYPADPSCTSAAGVSEACTSTEPIAIITMPTTTGTTSGAADDVASECASTGGPDATLALDVPALDTLTIDQTSASGFDSVIELLDGTCGGTALDCQDTPTITRTNVAAGRYYLIVDGYTDTEYGDFTVALSGTIKAGESCESALATSGALTCSSGYACKGNPGSRTCQKAACHDGLDNDVPADGKKDYPADPGCATPSDDDETDDCPSGPNCPACSNTKDDDLDGKIDYPADQNCVAASGTTESCVSADPITELTMKTTDGDTTGHANDRHASCDGGSDGPDDMYALNLPPMKHLDLDADDNTLDLVVALYDGTCGGTDLACSDEPEILDVTNLPGGLYYLLIDTYVAGEVGPYNIVVSGEIAVGGSCEVPLAQSGAITCAAGSICKGNPGSKTCQPAACSDGVDNDSPKDGKTDYPNDPGCTSPSDDSETDDCPSGPNCPACSNNKDDDLDGLKDFPADFGCASASGTTEVFCATDKDATAAITMPTSTGTTAGAHDDFMPDCVGTSTAPDKVYALVLPVPVDTLTIDTNNSAFDTVLSVTDSTCGLPALACADGGGTGGTSPSLVTLTNVAAGVYGVIVDGYSNFNGAYLLHVNGVVASGTACTSSLFVTGVLSCPAGETCKVGKCAP